MSDQGESGRTDQKSSCADEQPPKMAFISLLDESDDDNNNPHYAAAAKPKDRIIETIEILDDSDDEGRKPAAKEMESASKTSDLPAQDSVSKTSDFTWHSKQRARKTITKTEPEAPPAVATAPAPVAPRKDPPGIKVNPELEWTSSTTAVTASVAVVSAKTPPEATDSSKVPPDPRATTTMQIAVSPLKRAAQATPENPKTSTPKVCRCSGCAQKGPCRQCVWCLAGGGKPCALSFCSLGPTGETKQSYLKAIDETRAKYRPTFRAGDHVFCPENGGRYESAVLSNRSSGSSDDDDVFYVVFDGSMLRKKVRASCLQDSFLATLHKERARLMAGDTTCTPTRAQQPTTSVGAMGATKRNLHTEPKRTATPGPRTLSDSVAAGSRVLARFPLDGTDRREYFWGKIVQVNGNHKYFSVRFDDGDFRPNIPRKEILTEQKFFGRFPPITRQDEGDNQTTTYENFFAERCNQCKMCKLANCGSCESCVWNTASSGTKKRECVLRGCETIVAIRRAQPLILGNPHIKFHFSTKKPKYSCSRSLCFCKRRAELGGVSLRLITPEGRSGCLYETLRKVGWKTEEIKQRIPEIWADIVKSEMVEYVAHSLIGEGYYMEWTTCKGLKRSALGKFRRCLKQLSDDSLSFDVEISRNPIAAFRDCGGGRHIPDSHNVCLEEAWGAYLAYSKKFGPAIGSNPEIPFHYKWINPEWREEVVNEDSSVSIFLTVNGFLLEMAAKQSLVPNAGRGLFLTCRALPGCSQTSFVLPAGTLIDLGVYAPHTVADMKSQALWSIKNLLLKSSSECWAFDPPELERKNGFVFEVSDDLNGNVHRVAQRSMVVFANETCGKSEIPTISTHYDPAGAVHYLLGHKSHQDGTVELPLDMEIELKIDYGTTYERERVRKGYPRVTGEELKHYQNLLEKDDEDYVKNILTFTADDCTESIEYLGQVGRSHPSPSSEFRYRFLLALLSLGECMTNMLRVFSGSAIEDTRFCANGFDKRFKSITVSSFVRLLDWTCFHLWNDDHSFCSCIAKNKLLLEKASFFSRQKIPEWSRPMLIEKVKNTLLPLR